MKKFFKILGITLIVVIGGLTIWMYSNMKDRHPEYKADLKITGNAPGKLMAGFAAVTITPEVPDRWEDKDGNAKYEPKKGDTFIDGNGNGKFDPVWIAGFSNSKPANGIHDDTWARTLIIDDGKTRLAIVVLDAIGFMNDDVVDVRKMIPSELGITYTIITSTHTHEGPDLLGLWGRTPFKSGVNPEYLNFVKLRIIQSVTEAAGKLRPAKLQISEDMTGAAALVKDTRKPEVFDSGLRLIRAVDTETGETLGSLLSWGNHPETLWSKNLLVSSDYPHFFRENVEKGVFHGDSLIKPGIGGTAVFVNAALGGLMCTHPSLAVIHPFTGEELKEPSYEKAEAEGKILALATLTAMENPAEVIDSAAISLVVKTVPLKIDNTLFKLGAAMGVMKRGTTGWVNMRSELAVIQIGPVSVVTIPGEIYPELVNGPVDAPEGNDFGIQPVEVPVIRDMMPGKYKFVFGLANDEVGYILPKSQWDVKAPYTYGREDSPYGEENSLGPETAGVIHRNLQEMLGELK